MERLERAREVLSARGQVPSQEEVLLRAVEDLLEKRGIREVPFGTEPFVPFPSQST